MAPWYHHFHTSVSHMSKGHMNALVLATVVIFMSSEFCQAQNSGSCPTPVCPGNRQVVAICSVNDPSNVSSTFWDGDSIVNCPAPAQVLALSHVLNTGAADNCDGTTYAASIVSVNGSVFTSHLTLVPTRSHDGEHVACYSPSLSVLVQECTLDVLSTNVTGVIEQQGLSAVFVSIALVEVSGSACVDEYFTVFGGSRMTNNTPRVGPFSMDFCSTPEVRNVTVGTRRNGSDGPVSTLSVFTADTTNLYSGVRASHLYGTSGIALDLTWMVVDEVVMSQSDVNCSCVSSPVTSDSATRHSFQFSYDQISPNQITLTVSFSSGSCNDMATIAYEVVNFGSATVSPSLPEIVTFSFDESLLANGVNVSRVRGSCKDSSEEMFWDYPLTTLNITTNCANGSYTFQALTSGNMTVGFPFTVEFASPTTNIDPTVPAANIAVIGGAIGGTIGGVLVIIIVIVFTFVCCYSKKGKDVEKDEKDELPSPADTLYADPNKIEHHNVPDTGDEYALVEKKGKKSKQTPQGALYQDPNAIEHQTAPSGDTYAVVDKPKRGSSKKREPDVVPGVSGGLTYADIDVAASRRPKPAQHHQAQHPGHVEYADVTVEQARL